MSASYTLSPFPKNCARRVARPITSGSTPVAIGSSVPRCPTFLVCASRRMRLTTSWDVHPDGLSTTITPSLKVTLSLWQAGSLAVSGEIELQLALGVQLFCDLPIQLIERNV